MKKLLIMILIFAIPLCFLLSASAVYKNGSANGLPAPVLLSAETGTFCGNLISWECDPYPENGFFAVYRSLNGGIFEWIDSTPEKKLLDATGLSESDSVRYRLALCVPNYYGDGEIVYSDDSNVTGTVFTGSEPPDNLFERMESAEDYLTDQIKKHARTVSLYYTGQWEEGIWGSILSECETRSPSLAWLYYDTAGEIAYVGKADGKAVYRMTYNFSYYTSDSEQKELDEAIGNILSSIQVEYTLGALPSNYRTAKAVYSYLCKNVKLASEKRISGVRYMEKRSAYDALVKKSATPQGIALAAKMLFDWLGTPAEVISGDGHCFNFVSIDGWWYYFDASIGIEGTTGDFVDFAGFLFRDTDRDVGIDDVYATGTPFDALHPVGKKEYQQEPAKPEILSIKKENAGIRLSLSFEGDGAIVYANGFAVGTVYENTFLHEEPVEGRKYTYTLVAFHVDQEGEKLPSVPSDGVSALYITAPVVSLPENISAEQKDERTLILCFSLPEEGGCYLVADAKSGKELTSCFLSPCVVRLPDDFSGSVRFSLAGDKSKYVDFSVDLPERPERPEVRAIDKTSVLIDFPSDGEWIVLKSVNGEKETETACKGKNFIDGGFSAGDRIDYRLCKIVDKKRSNPSEKAGIVFLTPPQLTSLSFGEDGVILNWQNTCPKYSSVMILASDDGKTYSFLANPGSKTTYTDKGIKNAQFRYYRLISISLTGAVNYSLSAGSDSGKVCYLQAPLPVISTRTENGKSVRLEWNTIDGADGYRLIRKSNFEEVVFYCEGVTEYTDETLRENLAYAYTVTPFILEGGNRVYGTESGKADSYAWVKTDYSTDASTVNLSWNACAGADGYIVLRSTNGGDYTVIGLTKDLSFSTGHVANTQNKYALLAYFDGRGERVFTPLIPFEQEETEINKDDPKQNENREEEKSEEDSFTQFLASPAIPVIGSLLVLIPSGITAVLILKKRKEERKSK